MTALEARIARLEKKSGEIRRDARAAAPDLKTHKRALVEVARAGS